MKKLVVLTSENYGHINGTGFGAPPLDVPPHVPMRGVNVMLGGVMLTAMILVIFVLCYCCHKSNRKSHTPNPPSTYWQDPGLSMEIYTVDTQSCLDFDEYSSESRRPSTPGPPPPYELVVPSSKSGEPPNILDNAEPPSYEKACQSSHDLHISAQGYV
ncbi:uncharacterized protein LOC123671695 [Harmonia axyridis]|uniref:uncharacterized protein LOC123671695 n=1 Tax=Harmonia axyridis TaxID=115357 RepID=UPI001E276E80|nr:uncharacterized protein LOC123671695 [Harmonia axyridis]XP_045461621.1 uncharacterized protein LOC123671695 [Harmonia axyridis]XP_045461622.1 uncharacterized protein LOC123671695 [Harmonia axyridis]XP_045461623.1 uncharacterized protein LOC123671695 [Harmonia axyridis]XP_045461624.1 uncharacterized protein LOC123671695 [Harmonia axyridis]